MANTTREPGNMAPTDPAASADLLGTLIARRRGLWLRCFLALIMVCLLFGFFVFPQSYSSIVSISMQQPSSSGSIAGLLNLGSLQRKYIGVLKSRVFEER